MEKKKISGFVLVGGGKEYGGLWWTQGRYHRYGEAWEERRSLPAFVYVAGVVTAVLALNCEVSGFGETVCECCISC